jgi:hypothetical protein
MTIESSILSGKVEEVEEVEKWKSGKVEEVEEVESRLTVKGPAPPKRSRPFIPS